MTFVHCRRIEGILCFAEQTARRHDVFASRIPPVVAAMARVQQKWGHVYASRLWDIIFQRWPMAVRIATILALVFQPALIAGAGGDVKQVERASERAPNHRCCCNNSPGKKCPCESSARAGCGCSTAPTPIPATPQQPVKPSSGKSLVAIPPTISGSSKQVKPRPAWSYITSYPFACFHPDQAVLCLWLI